MKSVISIFCVCFCALATIAQEPAVVQPGAPGQPTKKLPATTTAKLPPVSAKDVEFMQAMIMHHTQAIEMVELIASRTQNKDIKLLGAKISQTQSEELKFIKRWLEMRGQKLTMTDPNGKEYLVHPMMPGMLTPKQMLRLKNTKGADFDRLFLKGMIQHHEGALSMVEELFATAGSGQDAELFNFASDVDTGQRGEIKIMKSILEEKPKEEKK